MISPSALSMTKEVTENYSSLVKIEKLFFYKIFTQHKILHIINIRTSLYAT